MAEPEPLSKRRLFKQLTGAGTEHEIQVGGCYPPWLLVRSRRI
ncbi:MULTISPECIES: hypothetical protein [unclassified Pseudomonas]|nr:hypothetical protein [Pseudomonas sp. MSSRFD41]